MNRHREQQSIVARFSNEPAMRAGFPVDFQAFGLDRKEGERQLRAAMERKRRLGVYAAAQEELARVRAQNKPGETK